MPRPPRLHVPGGHYHVILRGNHRQVLFATAADRHVLNGICAEVIQRFSARVHAFCWMSNHLHALVQIADRPLGPLMQRIAMRFSRHRHKALRTSGHLFERRYKARLVDVDAYFLTLLRYIHLNPVKAHIVVDPAHYPWSSHRAYLGIQSAPWLTTDFGLSLFSTDPVRARNLYRRFMASPSDDDVSESNTHPKDPRVLGTDEFLNRISAPLYQRKSALSLEQLATRLCQSHNITVELLRSLSRARSLTAIHIQFARDAIQLRIATLSDVARFLHRDPSALTKLLARYPQ